MKRRHGLWLRGVCFLAVATPALARAQAPVSPAPAAPPAPAPAAPAAAAAPKPAAAPVAPAPAAAPSPAAPAAAAPSSAAAAPAVPAPAATTAPAAAAPPDVELAPDPKLAPAIPLAPAPAAFDTRADAYPALPDIALPGSDEPAHPPLLDVRLGFRDQLIGSDSFDPFSEDDQLPTFQLAAGVCLHDLEGGGALAGVASLELSGTSASLRGLPTELDVLRLGLGPELRWPLGERAYLLGRISPQAVRVASQLEEGNGTRFSSAAWAFGVDASLGAALRIAQVRPTGFERPVALFIHLEGGYLWTSGVDLELAAGNGPVRSAPLQLGELSLHGLSLGGGIGVGY